MPVEIWDKAQRGTRTIIYKVAVSDGRPVQMLTIGPDLGEGRSANQKDDVNYLEKPSLPQAFFAVPDSCLDATRLPLAQMKARPEVVLDM